MRVTQYLILQIPAWKTVQLSVHCVFHCGYIRAPEISLKYSPVLETVVVDRFHFAIRIRPAQSERCLRGCFGCFYLCSTNPETWNLSFWALLTLLSFNNFPCRKHKLNISVLACGIEKMADEQKGNKSVWLTELKLYLQDQQLGYKYLFTSKLWYKNIETQQNRDAAFR